ncbi:MAG: DUF922 domain-containing Zn-dependent protease [Chloroflexi bacterium]|nr:DUF922 domain-containing Zn-dependent protease [Chloroflexota bacterium]
MTDHLKRHWLRNLILAITLLSSCSDALLQTSVSAPTESTSVAPIPIVVDYDYYQITGSTADELCDQMDQLGYMDEVGYRWDAYTEWYVNWSYPYSTTSDNCTTNSVQVQIQITFIFPQWNTPKNASQDLIDRWNAYMAALRLHEDGHKKIAIQAGDEILQAMNALPAYPLCSELEQAADAVGESILERYRQRQATYDQNTEHGKTQGAHFP